MHMEFSELSEYTRLVFNRISKIDPENARKIIGFLLLHDHGDEEMACLAQAPEHDIHNIIYLVKNELHQLALRTMSLAMSTPVSPLSSSPGGLVPFALARNRHFPSSENFHASLTWDQQLTNKRGSDYNYIPLGYTDSMFELQSPAQYFNLVDDHIEPPNSGLSSYDCSFVDNAPAILNNLTTRTARHYSTTSEFQPKLCHYYTKGFCKHGSSCRYLHSNPVPISESFSSIYNGNNVNDDHVFRPGSLENLEIEIVELLKSRRGSPISIASLPMIYYEKYGKVLQAEGYLTESQRHGKSGFSLTKLLTRLKGSIQVIDRSVLRPHGQHAVILAEDASKFTDHRNGKNDPGQIVSSARQIYLTFPADSIFTEDDVSDYFSDHYGLVEDVRIPCQQRRMFGFVTFNSIETVKHILSADCEHIICGARVLVKPYREKSKLLERKYQERIEQQQQPQTYYTSHYNDLESEQHHHSIQRSYEVARLMRLRIEEQQQQALEAERRLSEMSIRHDSPISRPYFSYQMQELKVPEEHISFPTTERFDHLLDVLKSGSGSGSGSGCSGSRSGSFSDENKLSLNAADWSHLALNLDSEYNLPESPFESPTGSST